MLVRFWALHKRRKNVVTMPRFYPKLALLSRFFTFTIYDNTQELQTCEVLLFFEQCGAYSRVQPVTKLRFARFRANISWPTESRFRRAKLISIFSHVRCFFGKALF